MRESDNDTASYLAEQGKTPTETAGTAPPVASPGSMVRGPIGHEGAWTEHPALESARADEQAATARGETSGAP
jgi:hypothetical protein